MALLVSIFFGFVPMFLFAVFINWLDRYEKEPKALLGAAFVWGVVIAGGGAYIINTVLGLAGRDVSVSEFEGVLQKALDADARPGPVGDFEILGVRE